MAVEILVSLRAGSAGREIGDIVTVQKGPVCTWGAAECPPDFAVVRINGISKQEFNALYSERVQIREDGTKRYIKRCSHRLTWTGDLPPATAILGELTFVAKTEVQI